MTTLLERVRHPFNNGNGVDEIPSLRRFYPMVTFEGTPQPLQTVCPKCKGKDIDNMIYRGPARSEFLPGTRVLKPDGERPPDVVIGQICRTFVPVDVDYEEPCGHRLWSTPVSKMARGRRRRNG